MSTDEGNLVLDPFIGTGTTAIAAKQLARKYIGVDIDSKYVKIAKEKLEGITPIEINGCYVSVFLGKIITVRNVDYDKVEPFLNTRTLRINAEKAKQLAIPKVDINLKSYLKPTSVKLATQSRLLEKRTPYEAKESKHARQKSR